jgi:hypothetical protein
MHSLVHIIHYANFMHNSYLLCHSLVSNYQLTSAFDDACTIPMNYKNSSFLPPTCNAVGSPSAQTGTIPSAGLFLPLKGRGPGSGYNYYCYNYNLLSIFNVVIFRTDFAKLKIDDKLNYCDISYFMLLDAHAYFVRQI